MPHSLSLGRIKPQATETHKPVQWTEPTSIAAGRTSHLHHPLGQMPLSRGAAWFFRLAPVVGEQVTWNGHT